MVAPSIGFLPLSDKPSRAIPFFSSRVDGVVAGPDDSDLLSPGGPFIAFFGGVTVSLSRGCLGAGDLNAGDLTADVFAAPGSFWRFTGTEGAGSSSERWRLLGSFINVCTSLNFRLLNFSTTTREVRGAGGCFDDVVFPEVGLGLFAAVLDGAPPSPAFFSDLTGDAACRGRGERPEGVVTDEEGGGFLPAAPVFRLGLSIGLDSARERIGAFGASLSNGSSLPALLYLLSSASASSMAGGSVGLSMGGRTGVIEALACGRGAGGGEGVRRRFAGREASELCWDFPAGREFLVVLGDLDIASGGLRSIS